MEGNGPGSCRAGVVCLKKAENGLEAAKKVEYFDRRENVSGQSRVTIENPAMARQITGGPDKQRVTGRPVTDSG